MPRPIQIAAATLWPIALIVILVVAPWTLIKSYKEMKKDD
jgi:hypothetical protein